MAPLAPPDQNRLTNIIRQSPPVDMTAPYSPSKLAGKTVLLTGGATGLGAAFARHWTAHGANLIIGDVNDPVGEALVAELRNAPGSSGHHHYLHCDVTSWASQVAFFKEAVQLSPTGELDAVLANAGISDQYGTITGKGFENPTGLDGPAPPAPSLTCLQVNLIGVLYTAHLALFWLQQNNPNPSITTTDPRDSRDRHLLLVGSSAGLFALPGVPEYTTSKHGVTGLFRSLRTLSYRQGIRVNMLAPYWVDTPILPGRAFALLAGLGLGRIEDNVDAATRFMAATPRIAGRALVVGPRASLLRRVFPEGLVGEEEEEKEDGVDGNGDVVVDENVKAEKGQAVWECYAHDYETVDFFIRRYVRLLNTITFIKGWVGFWRDLYRVVFVRKDAKKPKQ